jgi:hypothetical protein
MRRPAMTTGCLARPGGPGRLLVCLALLLAGRHCRHGRRSAAGTARTPTTLELAEPLWTSSLVGSSELNKNWLI